MKISFKVLWAITTLVCAFAIASCTGSSGDDGKDGAGGPQGPQGEKGIQGIQGPIGPQGLRGTSGDQGPIGLQGLKGSTGDQGIPGVPCAGCVDTASIVAGAVTNYWTKIGATDATTSFTTPGVWEPLPDMSLDVNSSGGFFLIQFAAPFQVSTDGSNPNAAQVRLLIDGVQASTAGGQGNAQLEAETSHRSIGVISFIHPEILSPGSHTISVEWRAAVGSNRWVNQVAQIHGKRVLTIIELKR